MEDAGKALEAHEHRESLGRTSIEIGA
jgi:hypothetical protein